MNRSAAQKLGESTKCFSIGVYVSEASSRWVGGTLPERADESRKTWASSSIPRQNYWAWWVGERKVIWFLNQSETCGKEGRARAASSIRTKSDGSYLPSSSRPALVVVRPPPVSGNSSSSGDGDVCVDLQRLVQRLANRQPHLVPAWRTSRRRSDPVVEKRIVLQHI
jgi:hypothetical protein